MPFTEKMLMDMTTQAMPSGMNPPVPPAQPSQENVAATCTTLPPDSSVPPIGDLNVGHGTTAPPENFQEDSPVSPTDDFNMGHETTTPPENFQEDSAVSVQLQEIHQQIENLTDKFDRKIATDEYKNSLFDNMHKELTAFRQGVIDKNVELMAKDIIPLIDSYSAQIKTFAPRENDEGYLEVCNALQYLLDDLTDVLYRQDIEQYTAIDENRTVDTRRQKIVKTVPCDDPTLNNTICEQLAPGYEKGEKIIRPEKISIYKTAVHPS